MVECIIASFQLLIKKNTRQEFWKTKNTYILFAVLKSHFLCPDIKQNAKTVYMCKNILRRLEIVVDLKKKNSIKKFELFQCKNPVPTYLAENKNGYLKSFELTSSLMEVH